MARYHEVTSDQHWEGQLNDGNRHCSICWGYIGSRSYDQATRHCNRIGRRPSPVANVLSFSSILQFSTALCCFPLLSTCCWWQLTRLWLKICLLAPEKISSRAIGAKGWLVSITGESIFCCLDGRTDGLLLPSGKTIAPEDGCVQYQRAKLCPLWVSLARLQAMQCAFFAATLGAFSCPVHQFFQSHIFTFFVLLIQREHWRHLAFHRQSKEGKANCLSVPPLPLFVFSCLASIVFSVLWFCVCVCVPVSPLGVWMQILRQFANTIAELRQALIRIKVSAACVYVCVQCARELSSPFGCW